VLEEAHLVTTKRRGRETGETLTTPGSLRYSEESESAA
jgi:hypothetical protein